jgi:hypothetical protein
MLEPKREITVFRPGFEIDIAHIPDHAGEQEILNRRVETELDLTAGLLPDSRHVVKGRGFVGKGQIQTSRPIN